MRKVALVLVVCLQEIFQMFDRDGFQVQGNAPDYVAHVSGRNWARYLRSGKGRFSTALARPQKIQAPWSMLYDELFPVGVSVTSGSLKPQR